ncbi:MAG: ATP-binding protein [Thermoplasmatota archaeon]
MERAGRQVGVVFGSVGTTGFRVAITDAGVKKNDYIQLRHPECGDVLGQIVEIQRESELDFAGAQKISGGERVEAGGQLSGAVNIIGYRDESGVLQVPRTPFNAGDAVFSAEEGLIRSVLGLRAELETGAYIGLLKGHNIRVYLDINALVQKHVSILAKTGGGKSYMVGVFAEELLKRMVPLVVIDPHGEYSSLMHPNLSERDQRFMAKFGVRPRGYAEQLVEFSPDTSLNPYAQPLRFDERNLDVRDILDMTGLRSTGPHIGIIQHAVKSLKETGEDYTLHDLIRVIREDRNAAKWGILNSLEYLEGTGLFGEPPTRPSDLVREGRASIINLKGVPPDIQELVVTRVLKKLFEGRKLDRIPPLMLVVEEAHNFCPQVGQALSSGVLKTVASEGRKFGLGLCVVTQRPAKIDKNILSQCNTQIILKVTNPNDLKAISQSIEGLVPGMEEEIQRLPIGVAIVAGGALTTPIQTEIRVRETQHGGVSVDVLERRGAGPARIEAGKGPKEADERAGEEPAPSPSPGGEAEGAGESPIVEEPMLDNDDSDVEPEEMRERGKKEGGEGRGPDLEDA